MSLAFQFATAGEIVFGAGSRARIGPAARAWGSRALLVTGGTPERAAPVAEALREARVENVVFSVRHEPTAPVVRDGVESARAAGCDLVVAVGGGSVIDSGKAIAILLSNGGDPLDYIEVVGEGRTFHSPSAPVIAVPTTAGAGAEVTKNAVLGVPEHRVKASLRSPFLLPRMALVDPELTLTLPPALTASTGLDALTQLIEPFVSGRANAFTDMFCLEGIRRAAAALPRAFRDGRDPAAREDMAMASLLGGLALANAGLGAVHGFAAPLGGMCSAPHGAVCAALLPGCIEANLRALRSRAPTHPALERYDMVAVLLTARPTARAEDGIEWIRALAREMGIPPLGAYGIRAADMPALVSKAAAASSMKANPIRLTEAELETALAAAL